MHTSLLFISYRVLRFPALSKQTEKKIHKRIFQKKKERKKENERSNQDPTIFPKQTKKNAPSHQDARIYSKTKKKEKRAVALRCDNISNTFQFFLHQVFGIDL